MVTNTIAAPPFGQAVATQKSSTAPIVTNARAPLTTAGSQSATPGATSRYPAGVPAWGIDEQRQSVEHARYAIQNFGRFIGEQPLRWRIGRQGEQRSLPLLASAAQSHRISHPAFARAWLPRRSQLGGDAGQDRFHRRLGPVVRRASQMCRNAAPTHQRCEQAVHRGLQRRRPVAQVAGLSERLVDHRVELDDAAQKFASLGLRVRQLRPRQCQHAGKSARDIGRQIGQ